jgi:hypothetical protein
MFRRESSWWEMHEIMVRPLPAGCRLTALFDSSCCHSGSALDLPYEYVSFEFTCICYFRGLGADGRDITDF